MKVFILLVSSLCIISRATASEATDDLSKFPGMECARPDECDSACCLESKCQVDMKACQDFYSKCIQRGSSPPECWEKLGHGSPSKQPKVVQMKENEEEIDREL